jgi:hypothetical protein
MPDTGKHYECGERGETYAEQCTALANCEKLKGHGDSNRNLCRSDAGSTGLPAD